MDPTANGSAELDDHSGSRVLRGLGVAVFVLLAIFWIWAFANRDSIAHPDAFDDPAWVEQANGICEPRQAAIASLKNPTLVESPEERAVLLRAGTVELEAMLRGLGELGLPDDAKGAETVPRWLSDYELYMQDRRDWADVLATGDDPPFTISGNEDGVRVTDLLQTFAEVNGMDSCAPSQDV